MFSFLKAGLFPFLFFNIHVYVFLLFFLHMYMYKCTCTRVFANPLLSSQLLYGSQESQKLCQIHMNNRSLPYINNFFFVYKILFLFLQFSFKN